jgi:hypothetical protein
MTLGEEAGREKRLIEPPGALRAGFQTSRTLCQERVRGVSGRPPMVVA